MGTQSSEGLPERAQLSAARFEHFLFPRSCIVNASWVILLSTLFSVLLTGRQIASADWGLIDDHQIFQMFGLHHRLPLSGIWNAAVDANTRSQIFRPAYYLVVALEAAVFGDNVHLWYLMNTISFAVFLASVWWAMLRFVGGWLAGALTAAIALLPLWAGIWSRLGPSEIPGAALLGLILLCGTATLSGNSCRSRSTAAVGLAVLGVLISGVKETFLPLTLGCVGILIIAIVTNKISLGLGAILSALMLAAMGEAGLLISRRAAVSGTDYYGRSIGALPIIAYSALGLVLGIVRSFWLWAFPAMFFGTLNVISRERLRSWVSRLPTAVALYALLILMYAAQSGVYRTVFPSNGRYDFPAMLLVPFTCCLIVAELSNELRNAFAERTLRHAQFIAALFLIFALVDVNAGSRPALATAVNQNIHSTQHFADALHRAVQSAVTQPSTPIILEAHGPDAYEAAISMNIYLRSFGVRNPIAVRLHRDQQATDPLSVSLQGGLQDMQNGNDPRFVGLEALPRSGPGCISIGLFGAAEDTCSAFEIKR